LFEPQQVAIAVADDGHISPPVSVEIPQGMPLEPTIFAGVHDVSLEISPALVFKPKQSGITGVFAHDVDIGQIEIPIPVEIARLHAKGIAVFPRDQPFLKTCGSLIGGVRPQCQQQQGWQSKVP
jgi:hypothetical protein